MDKQTQSQLELFSQSGEFSASSNTAKKPFLAFIWGYEKTIFIILGFILTGIIAFTLGVEKGKRFAAVNGSLGTAANIAQQQPYKQVVAAQQPVVINTPVNATVVQKTAEPAITKETPVQPNQLSGQFTIQIASFRSRTSAQQEFETLKGKGYSPFMVTKKGIIVLYAGNFTNKTEAKPLLSQLQKRYKDCFIRRL